MRAPSTGRNNGGRRTADGGRGARVGIRGVSHTPWAGFSAGGTASCAPRERLPAGGVRARPTERIAPVCRKGLPRLPEGPPPFAGSTSPVSGKGVPASGKDLPRFPEGSPRFPEGPPHFPEGPPHSPEGSPRSPEGSPHSPEGSPRFPEGSPHSPEGSPSFPEGSPRLREGETGPDRANVASIRGAGGPIPAVDRETGGVGVPGCGSARVEGGPRGTATETSEGAARIERNPARSLGNHARNAAGPRRGGCYELTWYTFMTSSP